MKLSHETEALVVGAGPVGMLTALLLGENGINTHIVDQASRPATHSYACALHPHSLSLLDDAGIAHDVIKIGWIINTISFYEGSTKRSERKLSELPGEFPFVLAVPQSGLECFLEKRLAQLPNVKLHWNHRFEELHMDESNITATVNKLAPTGKGYGTPEFEMGVENELLVGARFVIGADGTNSSVRQSLDILTERVGAPDLFAVYEIETKDRLGHEMRVILHRGTVSVMWPLGENKCRWSFQLLPAGQTADFPEKDRESFIIQESPKSANGDHGLQRLLQERAPWFTGAIKSVGWHTEIQFDHWVAREFGRNRCWLAGDAAHQTGPAGMHSMNLGLGEAADLAARVKKILFKSAGLNLLEAYNRNHRTQWQKLLGLAEGLKYGENSPSWIKENGPRILASLPVSGTDLTQLLGGLGMYIK